MLPIIDISPMRSADPKGRREVANAIDAACRETGFFQVVGHGIEGSREAAFAIARRFFALPLEQKLAIDIRRSPNHRGYGELGAEALGESTADAKETFDMGIPYGDDHPRVKAGFPLYGQNWYPPALPDMSAVMERYLADAMGVAKQILRAMAMALDLEETFFERHLDEPVSALRLIRYPATPDDGKPPIGCGEHTDYGCITLLAQDAVGGLEVRRRNGDWEPIAPVPGAYVVNLGDLMARWTNDRWISTPHRVLKVGGAPERYSIPLFVEPDFDTRVACLPTCQDAANPAKYEPVLSGEWLLSRFDATYAYRQSTPTPSGSG